MKKYNIDGTLKKKIAQKEHCKSCNDGKEFKKEKNLFKTDKYALDYSEKGCGICLSKYKIPRILASLGADSLNGKDIYKEDFEKFNFNIGLNKDNAIYFILKIGEDYDIEAKKIKGLKELKEKYGETKECPGHIWITSNPFKTAEGTFVIYNCAICKKGIVTYKGKKWEGSVSNLINMIATNGISYKEQTDAAADTFLADLGLFDEPEEELFDFLH